MKLGVVPRKELVKMQQAIVVLYSRHVLAAIISHWPHPPHPLISTTLLGNMDIMQFFCLLDLLMKPLNRQACINVGCHSDYVTIVTLVIITAITRCNSEYRTNSTSQSCSEGI